MAGKYNMVCDQGSTFNLAFTITTDNVAWDLVGGGYTGRMQVKPFIGGDLIIELTTANGRMVFSNTNKTTLLISAGDTEDLVPGRYIYQIEFENSLGTIQKILEGKFIIRAEVTI